MSAHQSEWEAGTQPCEEGDAASFMVRFSGGLSST